MVNHFSRPDDALAPLQSNPSEPKRIVDQLAFKPNTIQALKSVSNGNSTKAFSPFGSFEAQRGHCIECGACYT